MSGIIKMCPLSLQSLAGHILGENFSQKLFTDPGQCHYQIHDEHGHLPGRSSEMKLVELIYGDILILLFLAIFHISVEVIL